MQKLDPQMGLYTNPTNHSTKQEVFIRRTYRRMESSALFQPPRMGASLAELSDPPPPDTRRYVLVEESRLTELARIEAILKEEKEALGEQCSWVMNDYHIDARIPIPATRVAINSLCDADMRRLASEFDVMRAAWRKYSYQQRYFRDMNNSSLPAQSYLANAPLAQRPSKFVLLDAERLARQLKMERDTMMYEDDCSFLDNAYFRASSRKKDYERYYILASRYGRMTEEEFNKDERPGRRYWSRALDGCLKFQRIWGAYWAVQSLRRYKGAKGLQKIVRGYLAYKKYHPLIVFRLKYGKSSYLSYSMRRWRAYNRLLKNCRESIAWWLENWSVQCFAAWQRFTIASREEKARIAAQNRAKRMHSGLLKCFNAWSWLAKRQKYIKMKARRLLGCPHFDMWMDFVETKKHLRKMFNTASKIQSVARMFLCRRIFKAKRKLGFRFGIVLRSRYKVDMRRNAAVSVNFQEWKVATEEKRAIVLLDAERARLHSMQAYVVEREKVSRLDLRKHLRSRAGRLQLKEASRSLLSSVAWQKEQAEKQLYESCITLSRRFAQRDFQIANPPAFRCVDPSCCATFTSERQYHLHYKYAANHRSANSAQQRGALSSSSSSKKSSSATLTSSSDASTSSSRKREAKAMLLQDKLKEQLKAAEAAYAARSEQYSAELIPLLQRLETKQGELQAKRQELDAGEEELRTLKLDYAKESKATKDKVEELERAKAPTMRMDVKRLNDANMKSTKAYNAQKKDLGDKVAQMQSAADALSAVVADLEQKVAALQAEIKQFDDQFAADSTVLKGSLETAMREQATKEEAERKKREAEENDLYSSLTPSTLHCLLMHPKEFLVLRGFLLRLLPEGAVIKPPPPTDEELAMQEAQRQAAALKAKEEAEAEALALASVIKVKGWTFVKGKGWVASRPPEKRRPPGKGQATARGGAKGDGDRATANPLGQSPGKVSSSRKGGGAADSRGKGKGAMMVSKMSKSAKRAKRTKTAETVEDGEEGEEGSLSLATSGGAGAGSKNGDDNDDGDDLDSIALDELEDVPATPVEEPKRNNALPEVHLLNCLDLWKAIHAWKTTMPSTHPSYTVRALQIFDTFLAPDDESEAEAKSGSAYAAMKSGGTVVKGGSGPAGKKRGVFSAFLRRLRAIFPKFSFNKSGGGGDGDEDEDSDIESDIESDSDDDEEAKKIKAERRLKRDEEARLGVIVRRTVNLSVLTSHNSWSPDAAEAMLQRLARIKDKNKGQKRASVKYFNESKETLSWWRRTLRLKARGFYSWSSDFVVPPDIFDGLQWALFTYLFEKVRQESGFEKSPSFGHYRLLCAADDDARERELFRDAKLARLDRFRRWARDEFLANLRAWYKMADECSWRASDRAISNLVDRALRICVDEFVWTSQLQEQQRIETTNMIADEAVTWTMTRVSDDWYESLMDPFVRSLIALGGDVRASLMEFCGMREKSAVPMRKRAYSVRQVKGINISELLASMETSADKDEDDDDDSSSESEGDGESEGGEKGESEGKSDSPPQTLTAAAPAPSGAGAAGRGMGEEKDTAPAEPAPAKKLTSAQKALLEMQQLGHSVDKSVLVTAAPKVVLGGGASKKPKKKMSTAEAAVRIQRRVRGNNGRKRGRAAFVKVWLKRFDHANNLPFYSNVTMGTSQWTPPSVYAKLFPWTSKAW